VLLQNGAVLDEGPVQRVLEPGVLSRCFRVPFETVTLSDGRRMPVALGAAA
jgi:ABC-type cobalamin transport system ATPase subunit